MSAAGEIFRNKGVIPGPAQFIGILGNFGEEGEGVVDTEDIEFAGGELGGLAVEKEADLTVAADGADARGGEGESFGFGVEGFEGAGD